MAIQEWVKLWLEKKFFRVKWINECNFLNKDPQFKIQMRMVEGMFPFLILNGSILTYYFSRKCSKNIMLFNISLSLMYSFFCLELYGEEIEFDRFLRRSDSDLAFFLRMKFIKKFPNEMESLKYQAINERYVSRYFDNPNEIIQSININD